jgi:hypothetical protein
VNLRTRSDDDGRREGNTSRSDKLLEGIDDTLPDRIFDEGDIVSLISRSPAFCGTGGLVFFLGLRVVVLQ